MSRLSPIPRFYEEDTVAYAGQEDDLATVLHAWDDDDDDDEDDEDEEEEEDSHNLRPNQYMVEWPSGRTLTAYGYELKLMDRSFQLGDICQRTRSTNLMTGVVVDIDMQVAIRSIATKAKSRELMSSKFLRSAAHIRTGDHVIYNGWIGIVMDVFEEALLSVKGKNQVLKAFSMDTELRLGVPSRQVLDDLQDLFSRTGKIRHADDPSHLEVGEISQTHALISWLAINQKLSPTEQDRIPQPNQIWNESMGQLTLVRQHEEHKYAVGDNVIIVGDPPKEKEASIDSSQSKQIYQISGCTSNVEVLWQDGSRTWQKSIELEEPATIEDHDVWPGEHIIYRNLSGEEMGAVVQTMEVNEQTVTLCLYNDLEKFKTTTVSVLECKSEGSPDFRHGINRGDAVLISTKSTGYPPPSVPKLGKSLLERDKSQYDYEELQGTMRVLGIRLGKLSRRRLSRSIQVRLATEANVIDWYGTVIDCLLDGSISIRLPDGRTVHETVDKLTILMDDDDDDGDDDEDEDDDDEDDESESSCHCSSCTAAAPWVTSDGIGAEDDGWEDAEEEEGEKSVEQISLEEVKEQDKEIEGRDTEREMDNVEVKSNNNHHHLAETFKILEQAPKDHAFLGKTHYMSQNRSFLSRIHREYRILTSSLPEDILVRSYEDRMDLFRAVIIGSRGTPYQDAPFCIDFQLGPNFPSTPPIAHFHSWSQGHGRISPNLYEEGRVCLSLLNTWQGEEEVEHWNPGKSTLLQILISIQALVLVVEPYLTEPGHEKTIQSELGQRNSQLYSEKAYILSRRFILHALKSSIEGFDEELAKVYYRRGRLAKSIQAAQTLIDQEESVEQTTTNEATLRLTKGGSILLRQILNELQALQARFNV